MDRSDQAVAYHKQGYNCAQAIVLAFAEESGLSYDQCAKLAAGLGGGVGQLRETCGAVTGMSIALGLINARVEPTPENKQSIYAQTRALAERFERVTGSMRCQELLHLSSRDDPVPPPEDRPCDRLIREAALILEESLNAQDNHT